MQNLALLQPARPAIDESKVIWACYAMEHERRTMGACALEKSSGLERFNRFSVAKKYLEQSMKKTRMNDPWDEAIEAVGNDDADKLAGLLRETPSLRDMTGVFFSVFVEHRNCSILHMSAFADRVRCVELLAAEGLAVHAAWGCSLPVLQGHTPLSLAIMCEDKAKRRSMARALMSSVPRAAGKDGEGWKMAMLVAARERDLLTMEEIRAHVGSSGDSLWPEVREANKHSLLHFAASHGHRNMLAMLWEWPCMRPLAEQLNSCGRTVEEEARANGNDKLAQEVAERLRAEKEAQALSTLIEPPIPTKARAARI